MSRPTLSIIMTNYNHGHLIAQSLDSILAQSYRPDEIVIIDDASTDDSATVIAEYVEREPSIQLVRNSRNAGPLANANTLLTLASGDYVYGASADDKILPEFLKTSMSLLANYPEAGLCSTLSRSIDADGNDKGVFPSPVVSTTAAYVPPAEVRSLLLRYGSWIKGNTVIYQKQALILAGGYNPRLRAYADGFVQQVIALRHGACFIPYPLACFREMKTNYSAQALMDMETVTAILDSARELMTTRYADSFPAAYVPKWEKRFLWSARVSGWYSARRNDDRFCANPSRKPPTNSATTRQILQSASRLCAFLRAYSVMLYWGLRYQVLHDWLLRRWLKRARDKAYRRPALP